MKKLISLLIVSIAFFSFTGTDNGEKIVSDFKLKNVDNNFVSLSDYKDAKGFIIIFTCNHCPFAKLYSRRFNDLNLKYKSLGVPVIAVNSMDTLLYEEESFLLMQKKVADEMLSFPYLSDGSQSVAKNFGATVTPHACVIWKEENRWVIKYSGAIDDNGEHPEKATSFVSNAVDELLAGKKVSKPKVQSFGCKIFYRK